MSEMVERVAKAIEAEVDKLNDVRNIQGFYEEIARAAIAAMREPTDGMVETAFSLLPDRDPWPIAVWRAMIDESLREKDAI